MYKNNISATDLKQNTSTIINNVYYTKIPVIIKKHGKPLVKIVPLTQDKQTSSSVESKLKRYFSSIPDLNIKGTRNFIKKDLELN